MAEPAIVVGLALPDCENGESAFSKSCDRYAVPLDVPRELGAPECDIRLRICCLLAAAVTVPVTTVDEDGPPARTIREIRGTGQIAVPRRIASADRR